MMELLVVLVVAFLIVGPKDLPKVARWLAQMVKKARKLYRDLKDELGLDELTADVKEVKKDVEKTFADADVSKELKETASALKRDAEEISAGMKEKAEALETEIKK